VSGGRLSDECCIGKDLEGNSKLIKVLHICLAGLRKTPQKPRNQDWNQAHSQIQVWNLMTNLLTLTLLETANMSAGHTIEQGGQKGNTPDFCLSPSWGTDYC
jgi:hypothetical protein